MREDSKELCPSERTKIHGPFPAYSRSEREREKMREREREK